MNLPQPPHFKRRDEFDESTIPKNIRIHPQVSKRPLGWIFGRSGIAMFGCWAQGENTVRLQKTIIGFPQ